MGIIAALARYFGVLGGLLLLVAVAVTGCWITAFPRYTFGYRLTVNVETPEGLKTGSSVVRLTEQKQLKFGESTSWSSSIKGEAVAVNLGQRGFLFVLLKGNPMKNYASSADGIAFHVFRATDGRPGNIPDDAPRYRTESLSAQLRPEQMPLMVRFRDISVPASVESVDPRDLPASFGAGVRLRDVTLTTTSDPATEVIVKILPWLIGPHYNGHLDGEKYGSYRPGTPFANSLTSSDFRQGWPPPK
ncbi:hypothetical protein [Bosea sp. TND4EK4]|uniref:hypothetical protein n=1 Tax=Bosea sp. TND4EK4 TaxID=1907408 RepID=UPI0011155BCE|nr:hypothetical protein [Bosea sp. TND4EK4]